MTACGFRSDVGGPTYDYMSFSPGCRARQSLHIHLAALKMPPENQMVDIAQIHSAKNAEQHGRAVQACGRGVFDARAAHHGVFRALTDRVAA